MEPLESPRVQQVAGVLNRGEDTDGERTDDEVDYPSESFISQHTGAENEPEDHAEELEVTAEGTAGGPFGLKKVLFVRKKSDKGIAPEDPNRPPEPSLKDRFSKLGAGVGERFAALGSIMQDHGKPASNTLTLDTPPSSADPKVDATAGLAHDARPTTSKEALVYFQEYDLTYTSTPSFSVVEGPGGKGAVVSWDEDGGRKDSQSAPATAAGDAGGRPLKESDEGNVPASGAVVLAVDGESVVDVSAADISARLAKFGVGEQGHTNGEAGPASERAEASPDESNSACALVVRFREKSEARQMSAQGGGGEVFRNRMKAMATGLGSLFHAKEMSGSAVQDCSESSGKTAAVPGNPAGATTSEMFVLAFQAERVRAGLPFTIVDAVGNGGGVMVSGVEDGYTSSLAAGDEVGVSAAGTAAVSGRDPEMQESSGVLAPGAVVLRVAGKNVEKMRRDRVCKELEAAAADHSAVKILFRRAPTIYRASVAAQLALEQSNMPHVHVGTWQPLLKRRAGVTLGGAGDGENGGGGGGVIGLGYGGEEWEDVRETMARAQRFVDGFRSIGIRVDVVSMQTVTIPRNFKSAYGGTFEGRSSSFHQAVRLWFTFPDERTVYLQRQPTLEKLGLLSSDMRSGGPLGAWVTVRAADASPCAEAGIPVGESAILTHVNGFDVSPAPYRSLAPLPFGQGEGWAAAVLPALESGEKTVTLTFV